jgi:hypothetical protein
MYGKCPNDLFKPIRKAYRGEWHWLGTKQRRRLRCTAKLSIATSYDETGYVAKFRCLNTRAPCKKRGVRRITALTGKKKKLKTEEIKSIETGNISRPGCSFKKLKLNLVKTAPLISDVQMGPQDRASRDKNCSVDVPTQIMMQRARFSRMDHLVSCNGRLFCKDRAHVVDSDVRTSESVFGRLIPNWHTFYAHLITRPISRLSLAFNNSTLIFPKDYVPRFHFNRLLRQSTILCSPQSNTDTHMSRWTHFFEIVRYSIQRSVASQNALIFWLLRYFQTL